MDNISKGLLAYIDAIEAPQGSDAWIKARLGKATASRIAEVVAKTKTGWGASRANYAAELIAERLTGVPNDDKFQSAAMKWGTEMEPEARAAYEFFRDAEVAQVGFIPHPTIAMSGASPDGLVGADGMVEIKSPQTATHIETLLGGTIPNKYVTQVQYQMACCPERQWCDWVSFDPRLPHRMRLFVQRMQRDNERIAELEKQVRIFLAEVDAKVEELRKRYGA